MRKKLPVVRSIALLSVPTTVIVDVIPIVVSPSLSATSSKIGRNPGQSGHKVATSGGVLGDLFLFQGLT